MKRSALGIACLLLGPWLAFPAWANAEATARLQAALDRLQSIEAEFSQQQADETGAALGAASGRVWLERPGRFRWNYTSPHRQEIVSDARTLWHYDPELRQVTERKAESALGGTPAALIVMGGRVDERFVVTTVSEGTDAPYFRLTPREPEAEFASIDLWLEGGQPTRLRFADPLGGYSDLRLHGIRSATAPRGTFAFKAPKGVEVIPAE